MRLSTGLMARGRMGQSDLLTTIGRSAEAAGLHRVWFGDHVVYPVEYAPNYPFGNGRLHYNPASPQLDVVVAMSWLLSRTERIGVGTLVMVIGMRQPVWLAKQLASLDQLSGGRLTLGVGVGWMREEYEALGVDPARRGARTDDYVQVLRKLWSEETPSHDSEFASFPPLYCNPKPTGAGGIPVWIGGSGPAAWDRVARLGDGWLGFGSTVEQIAEARTEIARRAEVLGRDPAGIGTATTVTGSGRAEVVDRLNQLRDAGLTEAIIPVEGKSPEAAADWIQAIPDLLRG